MNKFFYKNYILIPKNLWEQEYYEVIFKYLKLFDIISPFT
jgi:hypothetical protein